MKIEKRDGRIVDFDKTRVSNAIMQAMEHTESGLDENLALDIANYVERVSKEGMNVEEIQDLVVKRLLNSKRKDVGIQYIEHRKIRSIEREKNSDMTKKLKEIMEAKNIENSNANVNEASFSGKENKALEEIMEQYALNNLMSEDAKNAHIDNMAYTHDLAKYASGSHNCVNVDMKDVLSRGFQTRNGDVRPPKSVSSAMQLMAVIFQCQSQVMFGGVGTAKCDNDVADYVAISFRKHFKDGMHYVERKDSQGIKDKDIKIDNENLAVEYPDAYQYAIDKTVKETAQGAQALYHNLNTLESRAGGFDCPIALKCA